ncbi:MAG: hypothetical protein HND56_08865 [Pseudomonadota bacterium]|nr:hypothetical protein [Pseudomonadota bacterium]QKK05791.1 MAG: hypothetical protein HND56_08865 [Pseudomonadota bacterium]
MLYKPITCYRIFISAFLALLFLLPKTVFAQEIKNIRFGQPADQVYRIVIELDTDTDFQFHIADDPRRLVVRIPAVTLPDIDLSSFKTVPPFLPLTAENVSAESGNITFAFDEYLHIKAGFMLQKQDDAQNNRIVIDLEKVSADLFAASANSRWHRDKAWGNRAERIIPAYGSVVRKKLSAEKWQPYIETEGRFGKRILGEAATVIPLAQSDDSLLFADLRFRFDNRSSQEGNFGIGLRKQFNDQWIGGVYGFYDIRRTRYDNIFHQVTLGAEAMTDTREARINVYLPEAGTQEAAPVGTVNGGQIQVQNFRERALPGFDAELGMGHEFENGWSLWGYGGGYYFDASGFEKVAGPRGRLELAKTGLPHIGEDARLTFGIETQRDHQRGGQSFALARLRIPLSSFAKKADTQTRPLSALDRRMTTRIHRDVDVVTGTAAGLLENATIANPQNTRNYTTVSVIDANTADVPAAVTAAGVDSFVIVDGSAGAINLAAGTDILMPQGQILAGGGSVLTATGTVTGRKAAFVVPGTRPTINATNSFSVVRTIFQTDTTVMGLNLNVTNNTTGDFSGVGLAAMSAALLNNNVTVTNTNPAFVGQARGIWYFFNPDGIVTGNSFTVNTLNPAATAIAMDISPSTNVLISNNTLTAPIAVQLTNVVGIAAGSTGNVRNGGTCNIIGAGATGQIVFTDGTTCP